MAVFLIWGFGAFWLVLALLFTWSVRKIAPLPFSLTWWAFTFPLGAFTLGSQRLSEVTGLTTPLAFGWLAWVLLAGIWTLTLLKTIGGVASGKLFQPHP
jgi:tellurite resistance protein TehA-like permease